VILIFLLLLAVITFGCATGGKAMRLKMNTRVFSCVLLTLSCLVRFVERIVFQVNDP